jgi:hypothetical protein
MEANVEYSEATNNGYTYLSTLLPFTCKPLNSSKHFLRTVDALSYLMFGSFSNI